MNRFIRKIALLLISISGCFNSASVLGDNDGTDGPIANSIVSDDISQAKNKCSELLNDGKKVRIIFCRDNDNSPNSCFIMGETPRFLGFLMWDEYREMTQWVHCRTIVNRVLIENNSLDCIWDVSDFSDLDLHPLSETEFFDFVKAFPSMRNLVNENCHHHLCNHEHQVAQHIEQQYPN